MNIEADEYLLNDIDSYVIKLHKYFSKSADRESEFLNHLEVLIRKYGLSYSCKEDKIPNELKKQYKKTYLARFNKTAYNQMKQDFNGTSETDLDILYLLLIYGFNRMLRFNNSGNFNLPVGNVDFNANVVNALMSYFEQVRSKKTTMV